MHQENDSPRDNDSTGRDGTEKYNDSTIESLTTQEPRLLMRVPDHLFRENPDIIFNLLSRYLSTTKAPSHVTIATEEREFKVEGESLTSLVEGSKRIGREVTHHYRNLFKGRSSYPSDLLMDFETFKDVEIIYSTDRTQRSDNGYRLGHLIICNSHGRYVVSYRGFMFKMLVFELSRFLKHAVRPSLLYQGKFNEFVEYRANIAQDLLEKTKASEALDGLGLVPIHSSLRSMGLSKLFPFFADSSVEELYVDGPDRAVYVDHSAWGRLNANVKMRLRDIEALVTAIRRESGLRLDFSSPSLKANLNTRLCLARVSMDAQPSTLSKYAIDIRKLRAVPFNIMDLLRSGTMDVSIVSLMILGLLHRSNISIVGEPGSGKTTLLNALMLCTPRWWRNVYIEDTPEAAEDRGQHQVRLLTDPYGIKAKSRGRKTTEILKTLHRNPTYVVLGEVQSPEHVRALFQACASGIRAIHTMHARDLDYLIGRMLYVHEVNVELLKYLDLLVECYKLERSSMTVRVIRRVSEMEFTDATPRIRDLVRYDPLSHAWEQETDLYRSRLFHKMSQDYMLAPEEIGVRFDEIKSTISNCNQHFDEWKKILQRLSSLSERWFSTDAKES